jgi:nickel-dependent lactate racemase
VIVKLPYAKENRAIDLRGMKVRSLRPSAPPGARNPRPLIAAALDTPLDGPPLAGLCTGCGSAVVVVPDATRTTSLPELLPELLRRLQQGGIEASSTLVLVACGSHPPPDRNALEDLVGPLPEGVIARAHDCRDEHSLAKIGTLSEGPEIRLNRHAVDADLVIAVSAVRHHYFAGFGGGPKMLFPGIAGYAEIQANHARVFERDGSGGRRRDPRCEPGRLDGNPVAEEIAAAAELAPPGFSLCTVLGSDGRIAWAGGGSWRTAFSAAVDRARDWYEVAAPTDARLVVASAGGQPSDSTLIQAHKALDAACRFAAPGGELLLVAELGAGAGSDDMLPFLEDPRPSAILSKLAEGWVQYGHTTLRLVEKTASHRVFLHSSLDEALALALGFEAVSDPAQVIERWRSEYPGETVVVIPGAAVYPRKPDHRQ